MARSGSAHKQAGHTRRGWVRAVLNSKPCVSRLPESVVEFPPLSPNGSKLAKWTTATQRPPSPTTREFVPPAPTPVDNNNTMNRELLNECYYGRCYWRARCLLDGGADPNFIGLLERSGDPQRKALPVVVYAARAGAAHIVNLLVARGARVDQNKVDEEYPLWPEPARRVFCSAVCNAILERN
jgi:hypothetical protein